MNSRWFHCFLLFSPLLSVFTLFPESFRQPPRVISLNSRWFLDFSLVLPFYRFCRFTLFSPLFHICPGINSCFFMDFMGKPGKTPLFTPFYTFYHCAVGVFHELRPVKAVVHSRWRHRFYRKDVKTLLFDTRFWPDDFTGAYNLRPQWSRAAKIVYQKRSVFTLFTLFTLFAQNPYGTLPGPTPFWNMRKG